MVYHELVLDRRLRDWVFIPLTVSIFLLRVMQQFLMKVVGMDMSPPGMATDSASVAESNLVQRSQRARMMGGYLPASAVLQRKNYFAEEDRGLLLEKPRSKPVNMLTASDPKALSSTLKRQVVNVAPQFGTGALVNWLFSGFVVGKIPFPLSPKFRLMLQRGIDLSSLSVEYFTSLSLYILLLFGLRGIMSLVFKEETIDDTELMRKQFQGTAGASPTFDATKAYAAEKTAWELYEYSNRLEKVHSEAARHLRNFLRHGSSSG